MFVFLFTTSLCLLPLAHAGQLLPAIFRQDICSLSGGKLFLDVDVPAVSRFNTSDNYSSPSHVMKSNSSTPWTREPECITEKKSQQKYCVYTNENFANGRGITFFTSPSIAERIPSLPAFADPSIHANNNDPPWEIKNTPGRGNGVFATRTLHRGDPLINYSPLAVYQSDALVADSRNGFKMLHKTFDQLPKESRRIFKRMATHPEGDFVMERINTNAFAGELEGLPHFFVYPEAALLNHDCRPNAMYYHSPKTLIHATYASRTIHPGEEITNTYINILQSRAERQTLLQQSWYFTCTCSLCSSPHFHESDARIQHIATLQTHLMDWSENSQATPEMAEELLELYEEEQVHSAKGPGHMFAAFEYNAVGDSSMAKRHARLAMEAGLITIGLPEAEEDEMKELRKDPKEHWTYLARVEYEY